MAEIEKLNKYLNKIKKQAEIKLKPQKATRKSVYKTEVQQHYIDFNTNHPENFKKSIIN